MSFAWEWAFDTQLFSHKLAHRLRRWPSIEHTMGQCLVFAGQGRMFSSRYQCAPIQPKTPLFRWILGLYLCWN